MRPARALSDARYSNVLIRLARHRSCANRAASSFFLRSNNAMSARLPAIFDAASRAVFLSGNARNTLRPSDRKSSTATCCSRYRAWCTSSTRDVGHRQNRFLLGGMSPALSEASDAASLDGAGSSATKCTHAREMSTRPTTARFVLTSVAGTLSRTFFLSSGDNSVDTSDERDASSPGPPRVFCVSGSGSSRAVSSSYVSSSSFSFATSSSSSEPKCPFRRFTASPSKRAEEASAEEASASRASSRDTFSSRYATKR